ncbi:hypothetical protein PHYBLDRAFT_168584 [Phycomyces blakesleeanus NRRL 1555(-)]|uniref:Uncharacterized protein n=1 Tax=Phycomyces blakesleeanus (strain ATCC 8743b / DSM 1359 / FGSC 10004 / NBRC 33097 / NRRL 1555) TaxID=763407 RepID=A0A162U3X6_PHYB8|nr:hypothetical protein PHYBLDRAFT_168584 [Phycomyces blakesleeanus NRRL 1555(-)]OAD73232.1 hypothetical protein PHYBLDRAFT_168584 [Phycomyces blakesleeanus NRRL 1555(-)]|eukprot:XP_018291272.1 hypothetical protein PHYBLDRAFT_168584 [Phycomyces blakesleeanus NRRL 1555(-)]
MSCRNVTKDTSAVDSIIIKESAPWMKSVSRLEKHFRRCEGEHQVRDLMTKVNSFIENTKQYFDHPEMIFPVTSEVKAPGRLKQVKRKKISPKELCLAQAHKSSWSEKAEVVFERCVPISLFITISKRPVARLRTDIALLPPDGRSPALLMVTVSIPIQINYSSALIVLPTCHSAQGLERKP